MTQITDKQIYLQVKRQSVGGLQEGASYKAMPIPSKPPSAEPQTTISLEEKLVLENYASYLPRGNRQLKLNVKELTDAVLAKDLIAAPLTKTSGLNRGGLLSVTTEKPGKPKSQAEYIATIQNKNNLKSNPNYTGFKNDFKL